MPEGVCTEPTHWHHLLVAAPEGGAGGVTRLYTSSKQHSTDDANTRTQEGNCMGPQWQIEGPAHRQHRQSHLCR